MTSRRTRKLNVHVQGWLLALPAVVLLATFTHIPAIRTIVASLFATPRGTKPPPYVGLTQYQTQLADPIFWRALENIIVYALITVPRAIGFALAMALLVYCRF